MNLSNVSFYSIFLFFSTFIFFKPEYLNANPNEVLLTEFSAFKTKEDPRLQSIIKEKINQSLQAKGFQVQEITPLQKDTILKEKKEKLNSFLVHGYYSRSKVDNLNLYIQIYRSDTGEVIDAFTITDDLFDSLGISLDKQEIKVADQERISIVSEKLPLKLKNNQSRKSQIEALDDLNSSNLDKEVNFPVANYSKEEESTAVFKLI